MHVHVQARTTMAKELAMQKDADEQRRLFKMARRVGLLLLISLIVTVGANAALTTMVVFMAKDTETSGAVMGVKGTGQVAKMAVAKQVEKIEGRLTQLLAPNLKIVSPANEVDRFGRGGDRLLAAAPSLKEGIDVVSEP